MPQATPAFIDKIAMTLPLSNPIAFDRLTGWLSGDESSLAGYPVTMTRGGRFYWYSKEIHLSDRCKVLIEGDHRTRFTRRPMVETDDPELEADIDVVAINDRRPLRMEWNPSSINAHPALIDGFGRVIDELFGSARASEFGSANITRVDVATDVVGLDINRLIACRNDTTVCSTTYGRDGITQTMYLGGKNTALRYIVYDKRAQLHGRSDSDAPPITRIEVRLKQTLNYLALRNHENLFDRLLLREIGERGHLGEQNNSHYWPWFVDACRERGAQAALGLIQDAKTRQRWRQKIRDIESPAWWRPEEIWGGLPRAVAQLNLFPPRVRCIRPYRH